MARIDFVELALRVTLAIGFVLVGRAKLTDDPSSLWVKMFIKLGAGAWFQYLTGYLQISGGLLILWRRTSDYGAALLACTMIGAVAAHLLFLEGVGGAVFPGAILIAIGVEVWKRHHPPDDAPLVKLGQ